MRPYLAPAPEYFDRASVPPEIQELLDEWPELDPATARLVRAAVMSRDRQRTAFFRDQIPELSGISACETEAAG